MMASVGQLGRSPCAARSPMRSIWLQPSSCKNISQSLSNYSFVVKLYFDFLFRTFSVAQDLFEQIPKKTCFPMRTEKFEMLTSAQFACANDPTCSGLVESPKRRGQQQKTMYGNYSLTEREYLLCDYPQSTKNTSDTLLFKKRGM